MRSLLELIVSRADKIMRAMMWVHLELMVWSADMIMRGSSTDRKTEMTTISIRVVLFASLCRLFSFPVPGFDA